MTRPRYARWTVIILTVAPLAWLAMRPSATWVDSATVGTGDVIASFEADGRTRIRDRYLITAPIAAQARRLTLDAGDPVAVGDVLVVLDPLPAPALDPRARAAAKALADAAESQLRAAAEELAAAETQAGELAREADRLARLGENALVAREAVERAQALDQRARREAASARFRVATARHQLAAARAALDLGSRVGGGEAALELTAPVEGVVLRHYFESSRPVQPGDSLVEIGDRSAMEVEVDVLSADAVRLREGMAVALAGWGKEPPLQGRLRRIEPAGFTKVSALGVEEQRVWVIVDIVTERARWERLGDGFRVSARFLVDQRAGVTRVPSSAVFREGDGWRVFRAESGRARLTAVTPGLEGGAWTEVIAGLAAGDEVVVHPGRDLADGDRIRLR